MCVLYSEAVLVTVFLGLIWWNIWIWYFSKAPGINVFFTNQNNSAFEVQEPQKWLNIFGQLFFLNNQCLQLGLGLSEFN